VTTKKIVDVAVIIPDASPVLTLARIGRLDLLTLFNAPIHLVDQVKYEITKSQNDPDGQVADFLKRNDNAITIIETNVGVGFQARRSRGDDVKSRNLGETAVEEYTIQLKKTKSPSFVPLVLFEDPDVLALRIADMAGIYLLNTSAWLFGLYENGSLPEGLELIDQINSHRHTPMERIDRDARTRKVRSTWRRRIKNAHTS
jgi:hypothetical protein